MSHLTLDHLLWRMRYVHPSAEIVVVGDPSDPSDSQRLSFAAVADRASALAHGLRDTLGLRTGDLVSVLGWNDLEHFEMLLGVPLAGGTLNTINLRLGVENMTALALESGPRALVFNGALLAHPVVGDEIRQVADAALAAGVQLVVAGDGAQADYAEATAYGELIDAHLGREWLPVVDDERTTAYLFHTSGTTGSPKTYSVTHRSAILHCLSQATVEATGISSGDRVLPLAPFFHVNGWGLPLTCALTGASLVLAGGDLQPARIARLMVAERVTVAAAVPTVWYGICAAVSAGDAPRPSELREVLTGGDVLAESVWQSITSVLGVGVATAWGMTETMACSTYERERPHERAGKPIPLVELRLEALADGAAGADPGRLQIRGPFTVGDTTGAGEWFSTGDIATIDGAGVLTIRDREKDLIKSGGEWIASAELEQRLCAHPMVAAAAVVPMSDPRWVQRPVAYVVLHPEEREDDVFAQLTAHLAEQFPRWWLPDDIRVIESLPMTTVGKVNKRALRDLAELTPEKGAPIAN